MSNRRFNNIPSLKNFFFEAILFCLLAGLLPACEADGEDVVKEADPAVSLSYKRVSMNSLTVEFTIVTNQPEITLLFGDGLQTTTSEKMVYHTYPTFGLLTAKATVKNNNRSSESSVCVDLDLFLDCQ